jgi:uncharacterized protein (TIGR02246 family)
MNTLTHRLLAPCLALLLVGCSSSHFSPSPSGASACFATPAEISGLFDQWNKSLATGNASLVASNYAPNAILLPTLSNKVRRTQAERIDYFNHFLEKGPRGKIDQAYIRNLGTIALNSGLYTFTFKDGSQAHARYTFVYQKQPDGKWLIIEHHSSKLPE